MKISELIEHLKELPQDNEIVSIEAENCQDIIKNNSYAISTDYLWGKPNDVRIVMIEQFNN